MTPDDATPHNRTPDSAPDPTGRSAPQPEGDRVSSDRVSPQSGAPSSGANAEPDTEPDIEPQPAPNACGACGAAQWKLHAHLPIETEAYLAAAALNRRRRSSTRSKKSPAKLERSQAKPAQPLDTAQADRSGEPTDTAAEPTQETPATEVATNATGVAATVPEADPAATTDTEAPHVPSLARFPHGTAWRCADCGALALVWPTDRDDPEATPPVRRRSSAEFRAAVMQQVARARSAMSQPKQGAKPASVAANLKTLRVLDLNLGRGANADRNLTLLHELGLAKHQLFGLSSDPATVDRLNLAGYQIYGGPIAQAIADLPDDYFDLVLGFNAIEYWRDPAPILRAVARKLRTGGRFVLELANPNSWQARLFRHGHWVAYRSNCHLLLGETALRRLGDRVGLEIETLRAHPEPQAWKTSLATWKRRKRHPLKFAVGSGLARGTLIGLDRLRAACGLSASRYGAVWVKRPAAMPADAPPHAVEAISENRPEDSATF